MTNETKSKLLDANTDPVIKLQILESEKLNKEEFKELFLDFIDSDETLCLELCKTQEHVVFSMPEDDVVSIIKNFNVNNPLPLSLLIYNNQNLISSEKWFNLINEMNPVLLGKIFGNSFAYTAKLLSLAKIPINSNITEQELINRFKSYLDLIKKCPESQITSIFASIQNSLKDFHSKTSEFKSKEKLKNCFFALMEDNNDIDNYLNLDRISLFQVAPLFQDVIFEQNDLNKFIIDKCKLVFKSIFDSDCDYKYIKDFKNNLKNDNKLNYFLEKLNESTFSENDVIDFAVYTEKILMQISLDRFLNEVFYDTILPISKGISECVLFGKCNDENKQKFFDEVTIFTQEKIDKLHMPNSMCYNYNKSFVNSFVNYQIYKQNHQFPLVRVSDTAIFEDSRISALYTIENNVPFSNLKFPGNYLSFNLKKIDNLPLTVFHECQHYRQFKHETDSNFNKACLVSKMAHNIRNYMQVSLNFENNENKRQYYNSLIEYDAYNLSLIETLKSLKNTKNPSFKLINYLQNFYKTCKIDDIIQYFDEAKNLLKDDIELVAYLYDVYQSNKDNRFVSEIYNNSIHFLLNNENYIPELLNKAQEFLNSGEIENRYEEKVIKPLNEMQILPKSISIQDNESCKNTTSSYESVEIFKNKIQDLLQNKQIKSEM